MHKSSEVYSVFIFLSWYLQQLQSTQISQAWSFTTREMNVLFSNFKLIIPSSLRINTPFPFKFSLEEGMIVFVFLKLYTEYIIYIYTKMYEMYYTYTIMHI